MRPTLPFALGCLLSLLGPGCVDNSPDPEDSSSTTGFMCYPDQTPCEGTCCDANEICVDDSCQQVGPDETGGVDCSTYDPFTECNDVEGCQNVSGSMATLLDTGVYECPDDASPFACVEEGCEPYEGVICLPNDDVNGRWIVNDCIPPGWEPCPDDAMCG